MVKLRKNAEAENPKKEMTEEDWEEFMDDWCAIDAGTFFVTKDGSLSQDWIHKEQLQRGEKVIPLPHPVVIPGRWDENGKLIRHHLRETKDCWLIEYDDGFSMPLAGTEQNANGTCNQADEVDAAKASKALGEAPPKA